MRCATRAGWRRRWRRRSPRAGSTTARATASPPSGATSTRGARRRRGRSCPACPTTDIRTPCTAGSICRRTGRRTPSPCRRASAASRSARPAPSRCRAAAATASASASARPARSTRSRADSISLRASRARSRGWIFRLSDYTTASAAPGLEAVAPSRGAEILDGLKITLPFMVGAAPFAVIFGALATSQPVQLSPYETMALSLFVFSGSAQFVAIALLGVATPAWVIWLVTFILNLRHTLYAATLVGYVRHLSIGWRLALSAGLTDETFAVMEDRYRRLGIRRNSHWAYLASNIAM